MFNLERPGSYRLGRPPLVEAFAQVRYPVRANLQSVEGIAPIQARLDPIFPYMSQEHVQQIALQFGSGAPAAAESSTAQTWKFTDDAGWTVIISVDSASLSVGPQYGDFGEFVNRFRAILQALREDGGVGRCDRLGLRYVDVAPVPPGETDAWRTWFRPELTGWPATDLVSQDAVVFTSITQTQLSAPPQGDLAGPPTDIAAVVRHGLVPANTMLPAVSRAEPLASAAYFLDTDMYVAAQQPFDPEQLTQQVRIFHDQLNRFFRWSLTPAGEDHFELEELQNQ